MKLDDHTARMLRGGHYHDRTICYNQENQENVLLRFGNVASKPSNISFFFCCIKIKTSLQLTLEWNSEKWKRQQMKNNWVIFPKLNLQKLVIVVNSLQFCGFIPWWYDVVKQQHNVLVHKFYALWALQTIRTVYFPKR